MQIRPARAADLPAVSAIYAREAREGHATFDHEPRPRHLGAEKLSADDLFLGTEQDRAGVG